MHLSLRKCLRILVFFLLKKGRISALKEKHPPISGGVSVYIQHCLMPLNRPPLGLLPLPLPAWSASSTIGGATFEGGGHLDDGVSTIGILPLSCWSRGCRLCPQKPHYDLNSNSIRIIIYFSLIAQD
jgi:hypothetical protein